MKNVLVLLTAFFLVNTAFSQDSKWELYSTVDGVQIYTMHSDCYPTNIPDQKAILVKVVNTTDKVVAVEWDKAVWYNDKLSKANQTDDENHYSVEVAKNGTIEGSCEVPRGALYIYEDFITYKTDTKLTKFELQNIKVTRL